VRAALLSWEALTGLDGGAEVRGKGHLKLRQVYELVRHPGILDCVEQVLGPNICCWGTSLFSKPAGDPAYVGWHADSYFWGLSSFDVCSVWVALTPSTLENGCMCVAPSRQGGWIAPETHAHVVIPGTANMLFTKEEIPPKEVDMASAHSCELKQGECTMFHVNVIHSSGPNLSQERRLGLAIRYIRPSVRTLPLKAGQVGLAPWDDEEEERGMGGMDLGEEGGRKTVMLVRGELTEVDGSHWGLESEPDWSKLYASQERRGKRVR
jgi:chlorinating enzyme